MNPWIRKTILALALVIVGMVGVAFWKPAYLFGAAAAIAPDLTAKMIVKWSLYRKELIAKSFSPEEQKKTWKNKPSASNWAAANTIFRFAMPMVKHSKKEAIGLK